MSTAYRQAYLEAPRRLSLRRMALPRPGPGQVLVRVRVALTCGTDLKTYRRGHARLPVPGPFGHEAVGEIVQVGPGVTGWEPGQRVVWVPTAPCGSCPACARGQANLCRNLFDPERMALGAYADYLLLPEPVVRRHLFPLPPGVPEPVAALLEPLSCAVRGARRLGPTEEVLVLGGGPMGLLLAVALQALGAGPVTLLVRRASAAACARRLGAAVVEGSLPQCLSRLRALREEGFPAVVECTGRPEGWEAAVQLARPGGRVLLFGGLPAEAQVSFPAYRLHYEEVDVRGSFHYTTADVREAYGLLAREAGRLAGLITHRWSLAEVEELFRRLDQGMDALKVAVLPQPEGVEWSPGRS